MDLLAIRQALASTVEQATGICYPYPIQSPNTPCAWVDLAGGLFLDYIQAMQQGQVEVNLRIVLLAAPAPNDDTARISSWLSTGTSDSVSDILRVDKTLGGVCTDLIARRAENAGWNEFPPQSGSWYSTAEIVVDVYLPQ